MRIGTQFSTLAALLTTAVALVAMPGVSEARTKLHLCDTGVAQSGVCLEGSMTCSNAQQLCEMLANLGGCASVDFSDASYCASLPQCGEQQDAVVCVKETEN